MACYDTSPYICTYDSGGGKDYSSLATWEADSDNDLSGLGVVTLDCHDSQVHNDYVTIKGATNTSSSIYREVRSASSCNVPYAGKAGTGANFHTQNQEWVYYLDEQHARLMSVVLKLIATSSNPIRAVKNGYSGYYCKYINCVAHDCTNSGTGTAAGFRVFDVSYGLVYNCIAYDNGDYGFSCDPYGFSTGVVCCTAIKNGQYGFNMANSPSNHSVFNCYAADNTTGDFSELYAVYSASGWNASKDETADIDGSVGDNYKNNIDLTDTELDADYLAVSGQTLSWNGSAGNRAGRNPYNDLTATRDFDNFFKNDTAGDAISKKDIIGNDRPTPDTADVTWAVGASEPTDNIAVDTPVLNPSSGTYPYGTLVSISCSTPDSIIYYTTDGSDPTELSTVYTDQIPIFTGTIKAFAKASGIPDSDIVSESYVVSGVLVGIQLATTDGEWAFNPETFTYQWTRDNIAISGETGQNYTTVSADAGTEIRCEVTATNSEGSTTATSNPISVVA